VRQEQLKKIIKKSATIQCGALASANVYWMHGRFVVCDTL
jgi:hypothetical protein